MTFLRKANETTQVEEPISTSSSISTAELAPKPGPKLAAKSTTSDTVGPLLQPEFVQDLRKRWDGVQASFVDEPRTAVRQADELVASAIKRLADSFTEAKNNLEGQWARGDDANTEDLRVALKKYRTLFQKLLSE
jgi:hypothetical protein